MQLRNNSVIFYRVNVGEYYVKSVVKSGKVCFELVHANDLNRLDSEGKNVSEDTSAFTFEVAENIAGYVNGRIVEVEIATKIEKTEKFIEMGEIL